MESKFEKLLTSGQPQARHEKPSVITPRKGKVRQVDMEKCSPVRFLDDVINTIHPGGKPIAMTTYRKDQIKAALVNYARAVKDYATGKDVSEEIYAIKKLVGTMDPDTAFSGKTIVNEVLVRWLSNICKELTQ